MACGTGSGGSAPAAAPAPVAPALQRPASDEAPATGGVGQAGPQEPAPAAPAAPTEEAAPQIRALWVDAFHLGAKTPAQVARLVADAAEAGVNALIVQVRRRGDAYYLRTEEPRSNDPGLAPRFDALQEVIDRARSVRPAMQVHAWLATVPIWNKKDEPPPQPEHAFNRHGLDAGEDSWLSLSDTGEAWDNENYMLDPGHPAAAAYITRVAAEVARNYDVDGVHLDLIRYAGVQWGYNPVSVARFNERYGTRGRPARTDARWQQWRRDQVTELVRQISAACAAERPGVTMSAAAIAWGAGPTDQRSWQRTSAYSNVFQDWTGWLQEGILDVVMPMVYDRDADPAQRAAFDHWVAWARAHRGGRHVAIGVGMFLNDPAAGLSQIARALAPGPAGDTVDGVALYSYAVTNAPARGSEEPQTPNREVLRALAAPSAFADRPPFTGRAGMPRMGWKAGA
jgi:uncharacterized lipoprotein YddW (UPF0748 family)